MTEAFSNASEYCVVGLWVNASNLNHEIYVSWQSSPQAAGHGKPLSDSGHSIRTK